MDLLIVNDRYLSNIENKFVDMVGQEINAFSCNESERSFLIFPNYLSPRFRFLIHETINQHFNSSLATVSIGKNEARRLVVFFKSFFQSQGKEYVPKSVPALGHKKRPDKMLYVPPKAKLINIEPKKPLDEKEELDGFVSDLNEELGIKSLPEHWCKSKLNYSDFCEDFISDNNNLDCGHFLEIYDFSPKLKTHHLVNCISETSHKICTIVWVDDTHALAEFASLSVSSFALIQKYSILKLRPLCQAIIKSKLRAKKRIEETILVKDRPETSAILARRLVTGALGIKKENIDTRNEKLELEKLRIAKAKKKQLTPNQEKLICF